MTKGVQDRMLEVERIRDAFCTAVYTAADLDAALALVTDDVVVELRPPGRHAAGIDEVRRLLGADVLPQLPADLRFRRVSRTGDRWRVAQEDIATFTHDQELRWLLPGVGATGRRLEVLVMSVVTVRGSAVSSWRTLWDHAALLTQLRT